MRDDSRAALVSYAHSLVPRSLADAAPGLSLFLHYPRSYLRSDVVAGVTVGAVAVPSSMAMAELAGLPVEYGLYGTFLPLAVYALLGTSRQHVVGPDSTLAALTAVTVAPMATVGGRGRPGALRGAGSGTGSGDGTAALPGRRAPAWIRGGLLWQAGVAWLHQRSRADRDLVPARQASRNQRRRGRLLLHRVGCLVEARRCERADRAPKRGAAIGGNRDSARASRPPAVSRCARAGARGCGARRPRDHGIAVVGEVEGGLPSVGLPGVGASDFLDLLLPAAAFALVAFADSSRPCERSRRSMATRSTQTVS